MVRATLTGHLGPVTTLAFHPHAPLLVSGGWDGTVRCWQVTSGQVLATLYSLDNGADWLITTPQGYYTGSSTALPLLRWRRGTTILPTDFSPTTFHQPAMIRKSLNGK